MTTTPVKPTAPPPEMALCPTCKQPRRIYHDKQMRRYFTRHPQAGRGNWCKMSGKQAAK